MATRAGRLVGRTWVRQLLSLLLRLLRPISRLGSIVELLVQEIKNVMVRGGNNNKKFGEMEVWKYLPAPESASSCKPPWYLAFRADNSKKRKDT
jgi:hypothetical protein